MNPVINVPLSQVMRSEIALPLGHIMNIHTVGQFVRAWRSPRNQKSIEQIFDTPEQARNAAAICSTWVGATNRATTMTANTWWVSDDAPLASA
jgi:hypothetical protein